MAKKPTSTFLPRESAGSDPMPSPIFHEPVFSEHTIATDPIGFVEDHTSDDPLYKELGDALQHDVVSFSRSRLKDDDIWSLEEVYGPRGGDVVKRVKDSGQTVFHAVGDTGAISKSVFADELDVAEQMARDCRGGDDKDRPSFFFHFGDVVYNFGEPDFYYDQFYQAYRNYPGPIIAIPGNHDSFRADVAPEGRDMPDPLPIFMRNFCAQLPQITPEAKSLHRTAMTAPGVYFSLDAPRVRIVSLFSNALEDPGVISSESGFWPAVPDYQLDFLTAQLNRVKSEQESGAFNGCLLLAVHHPPFSFKTKGTKKSPVQHGDHTSNTYALSEIDEICTKVGLYPHAILSGHAHNTQFYIRTMDFGGGKIEVPFIVCGSGGHHVNLLTKDLASRPQQDSDVSYMDEADSSKGLRLLGYDDRNFGYLRVTVGDDRLDIDFVCVPRPLKSQSRGRGKGGNGKGGDSVKTPSSPAVTLSTSVDLKTHTIVKS
jgi:hypothetical protein